MTPSFHLPSNLLHPITLLPRQVQQNRAMLPNHHVFSHQQYPSPADWQTHQPHHHGGGIQHHQAQAQAAAAAASAAQQRHYNQIAASSNVNSDVPPGARWGGTPAKPVRDWFRELTTLKTLASRRVLPKEGGPDGGP